MYDIGVFFVDLFRVVRLRYLLLVMLSVCLAIAACRHQPPDPADQEKMKAPTEPVDPSFAGRPADKAINWDLAGNWKIWRYQTPDRPSQKERWEALWILEKQKDGWIDRNGQGSFGLIGKAPPQMLRWIETKSGRWWYFSINEQSFGLLNMTDEFGERYMAVRSD